MTRVNVLAGACLAAILASCGPGDPPRPASDAAVARPPLFVKVDHFFASAPNAEALFRFFRDTLELAEAWPYKDYGDFASGGVTVGNTMLELVKWAVPAGEVLPTEWKSIAFEPAGNTAATIAGLEARGIGHGAPDTNRTKDKSGKDVVGWTNIDLSGLSPSGVLFVCEYAAKEKLAESNRTVNGELARREGGPLGVVSLAEIVVGVSDLDSARTQWRTLLTSPEDESEGLFRFGDGPAIRLVQAEQPGMKEIVLRVHSLERARSFLAGRGMLATGPDGRMVIAPAAIGGLRVTLTEQ